MKASAQAINRRKGQDEVDFRADEFHKTVTSRTAVKTITCVEAEGNILPGVEGDNKATTTTPNRNGQVAMSLLSKTNGTIPMVLFHSPRAMQARMIEVSWVPCSRARSASLTLNTNTKKQ